MKEIELGIDLTSLKSELVKDSASNRRSSISENELDNKMIEAELELISSIPINKWNEISRLSSSISEVPQHLKDRSINIMSTLKQKRQLNERQRQDAIWIIDLILKKAPEFFDEIQPSLTNNVRTKKVTSEIKLNKSLITKMVEWDTKAKVLSPRELQYVADFAYGLKKLNDFHEQNIRRHLKKLKDAGFEY